MLQSDLSSLNDPMNRINENVEAYDNHVTTELVELATELHIITEEYNGYITPEVQEVGDVWSTWT